MRERVPLAWGIYQKVTGRDAADAEAGVRAGFHAIKLKVGALSTTISPQCAPWRLQWAIDLLRLMRMAPGRASLKPPGRLGP